MNQLNFQSYWDVAKAVIYAVGGPAVIILGLSTFIGNFWSKSRLENAKSEHRKELERLKSQLEQARTRSARYSEKQFDLYNSLWLNLNHTKELADSLWESATRAQLPAFADQIRQTRRAATDNMLLIEESDYLDLDKLLKQFEEFRFGKQKLIDIKSVAPNSTPIINASDRQIVDAIGKNRKLRDKYTKLIMKVGRSFRKQIKG